MSEELSLEQFKAAILEDGVIDADEVAKIKTRLYEDGIIDREEADFLFDSILSLAYLIHPLSSAIPVSQHPAPFQVIDSLAQKVLTKRHIDLLISYDSP